MNESERLASMDEVTDLIRENQARVLAGTGSPKILVGAINIADGLNFHTIHMVKMGASLVSIGVDPSCYYRPDRLYCAPDELLPIAMKRLPKKWKPDFFWDSQAENGHYFSVGLGEIEIPTIVSFNHAHLGQSLLHMRPMFDCIIAPSKNMLHFGTHHLPFGASWGTMSERIRMFGELYSGGDKPIDASCAIGSEIGKQSVRHSVLAEIAHIKEKRPDLRIEIRSGLSQGEYFRLLAASKVSINVGAWGCSMAYRPFEIIAQEAIMVHFDETGYGSKTNLCHIPFHATWYVDGHEPWALESSIEQALSMHRHGCSTRIKAEVEEEYSYKRQYERLFELAGSVKIGKRISTTDFSRHAFAVNHLTGFQDLAKPHAWALTDADKNSLDSYQDSDWDVCLWQPEGLEERWEWQTALALGENPREVYRRAHVRALTALT